MHINKQNNPTTTLALAFEKSNVNDLVSEAMLNENIPRLQSVLAH